MNKVLVIILLITSLAFSDQTRRSTERISQEIKQCASEICGSEFYDQLPPLYFPYCCHSIAAISALGDSLILEDGSIWFVDDSTNQISNWLQSDTILIFPNSSWFSSNKFVLANQNLSSTVETTLIAGPVIGNPYTLQIIEIDYFNNIVYLSDNSKWYTCPSDNATLSQWQIGDYIIVGSNSSWLCFYSYSDKHILINSNMYNYVRADQ